MGALVTLLEDKTVLAAEAARVGGKVTQRIFIPNIFYSIE
jgi:hypothetical protein